MNQIRGEVSLNNKSSLNESVYCQTSIQSGVYLILLLVLSVTFNLAILGVLFSNKELRYSTNKFLIALMLVCLLGSMSDLPFTILQSLSCG